MFSAGASAAGAGLRFCRAAAGDGQLAGHRGSPLADAARHVLPVRPAAASGSGKQPPARGAAASAQRQPWAGTRWSDRIGGAASRRPMAAHLTTTGCLAGAGASAMAARPPAAERRQAGWRGASAARPGSVGAGCGASWAGPPPGGAGAPGRAGASGVEPVRARSEQVGVQWCVSATAARARCRSGAGPPAARRRPVPRGPSGRGGGPAGRRSTGAGPREPGSHGGRGDHGRPAPGLVGECGDALRGLKPEVRCTRPRAAACRPGRSATDASNR